MNRKAHVEQGEKQNERRCARNEEAARAEEVTWNNVKKPGTWLRVVASRILDISRRGLAIPDSSRKAQIDGRINFGLGDIGAALSRSLARLSPFFSRRSSLAGLPRRAETYGPEARLFLQREVSLSCLHGKRARLLFLSHGRSRGMRESGDREEGGA